MKIAVPVKSTNQIDAHFGHCEGYKVFTIENNNIIAEENVPSPKAVDANRTLPVFFTKKALQ